MVAHNGAPLVTPDPVQRVAMLWAADYGYSCVALWASSQVRRDHCYWLLPMRLIRSMAYLLLYIGVGVVNRILMLPTTNHSIPDNKNVYSYE